MQRLLLLQWLMRLLARLATPLVALWRLLLWRIHHARLASKIPGPPTLPILGNVLDVFPANSEGIFRMFEKCWRSIGTVFRVYMGPTLVAVTGAQEDHEMILSRNDYLEKAWIYSFLESWLGTGLLLSSGEKWRHRRKVLTPAFHFSILDQFMPVFHNCSDEFVRQLRMRAGGGSFDVWPLVKLLTLDVICETTMGVKMKAQTNSSSAYVTAVNDISSIIYEQGLRPWLWMPFVFRLTALGRRHEQCLKILHSTTDRVIQERKAELQLSGENQVLDVDELGRQRRVAFLDLLLLTARDGSLSDADIREEVDTFMFEGHDTTAAAISFTIFLLSRYQDVQEKVFRELESVFDADKPLQPSIQQLSELKYLEMVVKESLRLYPPVAAVAREITSDFRLASRPLTVPSGTTLFTSFWILHRNSEVFPDPEKFDPERFSPEASRGRHPYAYLPFSAGSRNCIGQRFAVLEVKSVLAKTIWNFRISPDPDYEPILVWELIMKTKNGVFVSVEERRRRTK